MAMGTRGWSAASCQTRCASAELVGPPQTWCSQHRFRTSRSLPPSGHPSRGHGAEVTRSWRRRPGRRRGLALPRERDRKVSRKLEAQVRKQCLWGTSERQGLEVGRRRMLQAGGTVILHAGEHPLWPGLGFPAMDSSVPRTPPPHSCSTVAQVP